ncbi:MAG TPA: hypothetical protein VFO79_04220 [Xanthomonadales bacterium]|nr:hypothetical protein [Xanthomonadales bacterium]
MKEIHIVAGILALIAGFVALYAAKGQRLHRRSGLVFAAAMVVMTVSAVVVATWLRPNAVNIVAGTLTFYLVCTGVMTVRPVPHGRGVLAALMIAGFAAGVFGFLLGYAATQTPRGFVDGVPSFPLFMFGAVGVGAAAADLRLLRIGALQGRQRIARHLWRMTYAMWIATTSAFLGQAKFFPDAIRSSGVLAVPVLVVTVLLFYWLVRTLRGRRVPAGDAAPAGSAGVPA